MVIHTIIEAIVIHTKKNPQNYLHLKAMATCHLSDQLLEHCSVNCSWKTF